MSNSHHFYGSNRSRGGIEVDESTLDPNANYWLGLARGAYAKLVKAVGEEKANHVAPEREDGQTWKDVYEAYKLLADLAEKQVLDRRIEMASEGSDNSVSGQWREHGYY